MAIDDKRKREVINRERAVFLKQLSLEPETHVSDIAERLGVDSDKAWSFVKAFLKVVSQEYDRDNPQFVKQWVNQYVEPELQLTDHDIANLVPLLDKYPDPSYKRPGDVNSDIVSDNSSMSTPSDLPPNPDELNRVPGPGPGPTPTGPTTDEFGQPERPIQDWGQYNVNTLNRTYDLSFLSRLTRVGLMRFVLQRVPVPPPSPRIESFIQIFSSNEDDHMVSPDTLRRELRDYFGEKTGEHAAHNFVNYIHYLPPIEQFGVRKAQGLRGMPGEGMGSPGFGAAPGGFNPSSPFSMGSQFENPFDTYYHREGVLGFGMDIRSPSAMRLIWEYEQQKRRDREQERKQDKIMNEIRQSMQMQMFDFMNQLKNGKGGNGMMGGGGYNEMVMPLLIAAMSGGSIGMEPYTDAEGKTSMRIVPQRGANAAAAAADPDRLTLRDLMEMTNQFNSRIDAKAAENQALRDGILQDLRSKLETRKDTPEMLLEYKKLFQELSPQGQGGVWAGANPLEIARVMLEKEKIVTDRERADKVLERAYENKKETQAIEIEKQREANKTKNVLIKSMAGLLGNTAPMMLNLILMLTGRQPMNAGVTMPGAAPGGGGMGGMLGGLANMLGPLLGGMMGGGDGGGGGGLGGLFGGGGGGDEDEGGNGEAGGANPFAAIFGGAKPKPATGVPGSASAAAAAPASYSAVPEETYDVSDIMSSIQNMFNIGGGNSQSAQAQAQAAPIPQSGTMPFMGFGPTAPSQEQQFSAPSAAYNRRPTVNTGMPANAFEEAETIPTQQVFQVNTNLPPYQNQFYQQRQQFTQPQPQQQPQQVIPIEQSQPQEATGVPAAAAAAETEEYREYKPEDFINTPKEKLAEFESEAKKSLEQTESYLKSIRAVMEGTT